MSRIALATDSAELEQRLRSATDHTVLALPAAPLGATPDHLFDAWGASAPEVVVLDAEGPGTARTLALAAEVGARCPGTSVLLVSDRAAEIGLPAMRSGVRDILEPAAGVDDIRAMIDRATHAARTPGEAEAPSGQVISVVSPKGGVGKTTIATNLAVGLARTAPHSTVLVDLDIQFGDVASALRLDPEYTLPDAVRGPASRDTMILKTFLTVHETGLYVLCAPDSPAAADAVGADDVGRLLALLASEFRYVVVDTAPGLSEHTLAAMDETTDLVLVTSMDVPGVRGLRKELDTLDALGMFPGARYVALNLADRRGGLSVPDVEATLGRGVDLVLPRSRAALASVNLGVPLLQSGARDPMTKQLRTLVGRYAGVPETPRRFGRWAATSTAGPTRAETTPPAPVAAPAATTTAPTTTTDVTREARPGRSRGRHRGGRR